MPPPLIHRRVVTIAGHSTRFLEIGQGRPLLLVPSPFVLGRTYRDTMIALSRSFRVLAVELPATSTAPREKHGWDFSQYAHWLIAFLRSQQLGPLPLIGHSNSGSVVLLAALHAPELVSHLILADTVGADTSFSLFRVLLRRLIDAGLEHELTLEGWPQLLQNILAHTANAVRQVQLAAYQDLRPAAARTVTPTLLAWGRRDQTQPLRCARALHAVMPDSTLYLSPTGSHDWIIDHAAEFAAVVRDFVRGP